jgi:hypothetical protein
MTCGRWTREPGALDRWHRLWCGECRAAQRVDALIMTGVTKLRAEPVAPEALAATLRALDLESGAATRTLPNDRLNGHVGARRLLLGAGLAALALFAALTFFPRAEMGALAATMAALRQVSTYHWTGVWVSHGQPLRWESWYAEGQYREDLGDKTTVDDGQQRRSHRAGTRVQFVDRSALARRPNAASLYEPDGFLKRIQQMQREPGWFVRVEEGEEQTPEGRRLRFQIFMSMDRRVHPTHDQKSRVTLLVDPGTRLPVRWVNEEWRDAKWQLSNRVDRIEYDVAVPDRVFQLQMPPGTRTVNVDWSHRTRARLAAQTAADGREVVLRAIDQTAEGDVLVSVAHAKEGDRLQPPTPQVVDMQATDERGRVYVDASSGHIAPTFEVWWLVPLVPRKPGEPGPRRLTITAELNPRVMVTFRDLPAPPPAYETVGELPPYIDSPCTNPLEVEKIRARGRAQYQRLRELRRLHP